MNELLDKSSERSPIIEIDNDRLLSLGYCVADRSRPLLRAQFRSIRQHLSETLRADGAGPVSIVAVTSAVPGEGKSFISLNLALGLASEKGAKVTLVDFDLMRPRMTNLFDCDGKTGLADALGEPLDLGAVAYSTNRPNLEFIPIGSDPRADLDLLSGQAVDHLITSIHGLRERHIFVFDCPPMLANEDARYLAQRVELTVMVVKADATPQHWTVDALEKAGSRAKIALLLNNRVGSVTEQYYGYGEALKDYRVAG